MRGKERERMFEVKESKGRDNIKTLNSQSCFRKYVANVS